MMATAETLLPEGADGETDVRQQAALWLIELQDDSNPERRAHWQQWHDSAPEHRAAWARLEAFGNSLRQVPAPLARAALAPPKTRIPRTPRRQALKALAVLLTAGGVGAIVLKRQELPVLLAGQRTGPGERRQLTLEDGSRIDLNVDTALDIRFDAKVRRLVLHAGEIHIVTAADTAGRPFIVETPQGSAQALGTRFIVRLDDDRASLVAVHAGKVALRPRQATDGVPLVLEAGQQARFTEHGSGTVSRASAADIGWTHGMLIAEDMPLPRFIAEFARQTGWPLHCDPALGHLKVSGSYPLNNPDAVLDLLTRALPIRVVMRRRWWGQSGLEVVAT